MDVWRKIGRKKKADEEAFLRDNPVEFVQEGNTVTIRSHGKSKSNWSWSGKNQNEAKYTISVPAQFNAQLKTGGGGVNAVDLTGDVKARTGGGRLSFARLHGPLNGETGGGSINTSDCEGTSTSARAAAVSKSPAARGPSMAKTGGGSVSVRKFQGPVARYQRRRRTHHRECGRRGGWLDGWRFN